LRENPWCKERGVPAQVCSNTTPIRGVEVYTKEEVDLLLQRIARLEKLLSSLVLISLSATSHSQREFEELTLRGVQHLEEELGHPIPQAGDSIGQAALFSAQELTSLLENKDPPREKQGELLKNLPSRFEREDPV
jgi:hypothetical protein